MATSMVKGNPVKLMLSFAFPLLIGNLLQQTYNIIDAAIVGQALGPEALASVGASSSVQFLVLGFCMGSCTGFSVPVAKYFGAGKLDKMRDYIFNGAALAVLIAAILTTLCSLLCAPILHLLSVPSDIFADAYAYQLVIFLGIPFSILYNYLSSILRAVGDSRTPFLFLAFSAILNIFLDLFYIIILHLGCAGAAIATISAQAISGLLCLFFISRKVKLLLPTKENRTLRKDAAQELLAMGIPTGLQFSITAIGSMVMQSANNGLGSVYVSAFTAAMKIKQFMMCPFDAISTAASVFCSQNLGAGQSKRIRQGLRQGVLVGVGYGAFAGVIMILFGRPLTKLFIVSSAFEAINASAKYLRCLGFFYWMLGILNVCRMVTQGLGYSGRAVFSGVMEMLARTIVCLGFVGAFGFTAICFADQAAWLAACCYIAPTMSVLREEIHENDCGSRCEIITLFSVLQRLPDTSQVIAAITRNLFHHRFWFIARKIKKKILFCMESSSPQNSIFFLVFSALPLDSISCRKTLVKRMLDFFQLRNIVRPLNQRLRWSLPCQNHFQLLRLVIQKIQKELLIKQFASNRINQLVQKQYIVFFLNCFFCHFLKLLFIIPFLLCLLLRCHQKRKLYLVLPRHKRHIRRQ